MKNKKEKKLVTLHQTPYLHLFRMKTGKGFFIHGIEDSMISEEYLDTHIHPHTINNKYSPIVEESL
jgi:hypothetical protein